jgi:hypothetical protein
MKGLLAMNVNGLGTRFQILKLGRKITHMRWPIRERIKLLREIADGEYRYAGESLPELRAVVRELIGHRNHDLSAMARAADRWLTQYDPSHPFRLINPPVIPPAPEDSV